MAYSDLDGLRCVIGATLNAPCVLKVTFSRAAESIPGGYTEVYPDVKLAHLPLHIFCYKALILLVPGEGIEPPAFGLQNRCSTAELTRQIS
jgi:hypothetical protein